MLPLTKSLLLITSMILSACGGSSGDPNPPSSTSPPIAPTNIQAELQGAASSPDVAGVMAYVQQGNQAAEFYLAGVSDTNKSQALRQTDQFKIASISKLFIAVSITKLIANQRLQLTDTLVTWLPELSSRIENSEIITIQQMIEHRSGIPDFDSQLGFSWGAAHTDSNATLAFALDKQADFAPNAKYEYSNTNYLLLGLLMDKILTFSHEQLIEDEILVPLDLNSTTSQQTNADADRLIHGYWDGVDRTSQIYAIAGGSMVSTLADTGHFLRALNTGNLLSQEERSLYRYFYNHSGWLPGYQSIAEYNQYTDSVIVIFVNSTGGMSETITRDTYNSIVEIIRDR